jgi:hypothetical protein
MSNGRDPTDRSFRQLRGVPMRARLLLGARQAKIWRELADEVQATGEEFEQLPVPAGDQAIIDRYLSASRDQIGVLRQIAEALDDGDTTSVTTLLDSGRRSGARVQGIAQGYGFKVCGSERG